MIRFYTILLVLVFLPLFSFSQIEIKNRKKKDRERPPVSLYKIISYENDTTFVDTTQTIFKDYKHNYLRKDDFDLLPFANVGQSYNSLSIDFSSNNLLPNFAAQARHFNYKETEDINYYNVPTPLTELAYKTVFQQGQYLDSFFTVNTSPNLNFSLAFTGLRSLGNFQNALTSTRNFRFTTNYKSKNDRYRVRAHFTTQNLLNEENGGLTDEDVQNFISGAADFRDRSVFDPIFEDAENELQGQRYYIDQTYDIIKSVDSLSNNTLSIGNIISFEDKQFVFTQQSQNDFFGEAFTNSNLNDEVRLEEFYAELSANYFNSTLGELKFNVGFNTFNYGYDSVVIIDDNVITNRLRGNTTSVGGAYENKIGNFDLKGKFGINVIGDFDGNFLTANAGYKINNDAYASASVNINSSAANYNLLLYQSDYINYNWQNDFDNVRTRQFKFNLHSQKIANIELDYTSIDNYAFFERQGPNNLVSPTQTSQTINYFRVKLQREFKYGKFALNNTLRYQNVLDGEGILNVPDLNFRTSLYFTDRLFKKALFLQTGITLNYFTSYYANGYDPLLSEFYVQNETLIGDFPRLDFFINMKVRQARIFFKAEHFNSSFTGFNFFSAPNNPYRDFVIRFGLVWNFFL